VTRLTLAGGRVLDPGQGLDLVADISVDDGVITSVGPASPAAAGRAGRAGAEPGAAGLVVDVSGLIVTPGVVDLHTHLYDGVSHYGVDADRFCLSRGVTTAVDAGSAGAQTFPGMRRYVIERAETRILAFLNIAVQGMISPLVGELEDIRWASAEQAVAMARANPDLIVGIKVRLGHQMVGSDPVPAMRLAREAADALDLPLMVHVIYMRPRIGWLLPYLGRGDLVTHCYHGNEGGILDSRGTVFAEVRRARDRGVLFDVGHGVGSFAYRVARPAIEQGFPPDTISSDLHAHNVGGPAFDQATTLSKLLHAGMELTDVIRATTATPAVAVRRAGRIGALAPGQEADLTAFELRTGHWALPDAAGETAVAERLLVPRVVLRSGQLRHIESPVPGLIAVGSAASRSPAPGSPAPGRP
jgi:dihydroorotase